VSLPERLRRFGVAGFGSHFLVFAAASLACLVLAAATDWRWLYWVPAGWGVLLLVHYLIYKASTIDQRWVDRRTEELRVKSYDRSHIDEIRARADPGKPENGDPGRR
jgi:MFS family permease